MVFLNRTRITRSLWVFQTNYQMGTAAVVDLSNT